MTEKEFIDWFEEKLCEITGDDFKTSFEHACIEVCDVTEIK